MVVVAAISAPRDGLGVTKFVGGAAVALVADRRGAGGEHEAFHPGEMRRNHQALRSDDVDGVDVGAIAWGERVQRGGVYDVPAALDGAREFAGPRHVADDVLDAIAVLFRLANERANRIAGSAQLAHNVRADETRRAG